MGGYLSHFLTRSLKEVFHHTIESSSKNIEFLDDEKSICLESNCLIRLVIYSLPDSNFDSDSCSDKVKMNVNGIFGMVPQIHCTFPVSESNRKKKPLRLYALCHYSVQWWWRCSTTFGIGLSGLCANIHRWEFPKQIRQSFKSYRAVAVSILSLIIFKKSACADH